MSIAHLLEDFGRGFQGPILDAVVPLQDNSETQRLEAYEDGYKSGWDDAVGANQAEQVQVAADLAQNLKDIGFTYQEACTHVSKSLGGVFDVMLSHFLPEVARVALAPKVAEELQKLPLNADHMRIELAVSPYSRATLDRIVEKIPSSDVRVVEDPSLTSGQVTVRFEENEVAVDFDALLEEMRNALELFQKQYKKEA